MIALLVITVLSLALAAVMSVVAWRLARGERQRSEARIEALAAEIHGHEPLPLHVGHFSVASVAETPLRTSRSQSGALAVGLLVVACVATLVVVLANSSRTGSGAASVASTVPATVAGRAIAPLELVALGHERDGDRLIVHGVVRNPSGANAAGLTAVVMVFNRAGGFVASGRAPVEGAASSAGVESTFAVAVPGVDDVGRYRVSFRSDDRVVEHLDRRNHIAAAQLP